jgi:hypothetical protein
MKLKIIKKDNFLVRDVRKPERPFECLYFENGGKKCPAPENVNGVWEDELYKCSVCG